MVTIEGIEANQTRELALQMLDMLQSDAWGAVAQLVLQPIYDNIIGKLHDGLQPSERECGNVEIIMRLDELSVHLRTALKQE